MTDKILERMLWALLVACVGIWAYNMGTLQGSVEDARLRGLHEVGCDELIRHKNSYTGQWDLVCEIKMQAEDDNLHIWRGPGAVDG